MGENTTEKKGRDALFDNARAVLIFLVLVGHLISGRISEWMGLRGLYYAIYMFHMPAFVFITGYFSRNVEKGRNGAVRNFLMPYLVFNTLFAVMEYFVAGSSKNFFDYYKMTAPRWGMWFLFACFIWKLLAKDIARIRGILPLSLLIGLGLPLFRDFDTTFTIGRIVGFLFFFVMGLWFRPEWMEKLKRIPAWAGGLVFAACAALSFWLAGNGWMIKETLYLRSPYGDGAKAEQLLMRLVLYLLGTVMTLAFLNLMTRKDCLLSRIGKNTLTVYVLHLFLVRNFNRMDVLKGQPYWYLVLAVALAAALTWVLSLDVVKKAYDWIMNKINSFCFR